MARILLAEDDSALCRFLKKALIRAGHDVTSFNDGEQALRALEDHQAKDLNNKDYDLLLADLVMPGIDGIELAQKAKDAQPDLKIMFITGFAAISMAQNKTNKHNCVNKQPQTPTQFLSKPFHLKDLVSHVDQLMAA